MEAEEWGGEKKQSVVIIPLPPFLCPNAEVVQAKSMPVRRHEKNSRPMRRDAGTPAISTDYFLS